MAEIERNYPLVRLGDFSEACRGETVQREAEGFAPMSEGLPLIRTRPSYPDLPQQFVVYRPNRAPGAQRPIPPPSPVHIECFAVQVRCTQYRARIHDVTGPQKAKDS